ncbi:MAG: hypothetical protein OQK82_06445 [Candidatus Pacearchaeota archaeon]|nr:hypothetical protein [Candidatus Pacearchaeota archaeon]
MHKDFKFGVVRKDVKTNFKYNDLKNLSKIDSVSPPSVFVGSKLKYPFMNVGILSPLQREEDVSIYDDAKLWAEKDFGIDDVIRLRDNLLNSRFMSKATDSRFSKRFVGIAQEIAVASRPVDVEIELKRKLYFDKRRDKVLVHQGMSAPLKGAKITENVKINRKVDKVMNDEIKSKEGIEFLYKNNFDEYALSKILSVGVLGLQKDKRFVPTRWSITATDDIISKKILQRVREYRWIEDYEFFFGEFLGNQYMIMLFPNVWSFELFELYYPGSSWNPSKDFKVSTDNEWFENRKTYARNTAGGYYATRLPIIEYLDFIKRQASVLVIRLETTSYWASLGVWVVRESVRKALKNKMRFVSKEELMTSVKKISKIKYDFQCEYILKKSKLFEKISVQRNLNKWFNH